MNTYPPKISRDWSSRPYPITAEIMRRAHDSIEAPVAGTQHMDVAGAFHTPSDAQDFADQLPPLPTDLRFLPPIADEQPSHLLALFVGWGAGIITGIAFSCWLWTK
jgi:hypothetical protein